jgi:hypothetical protein
VLGCRGALASASPLFLALVQPRRAARAGVVDALLRSGAQPGEGLRLGPWGLLAHVTPLGAAALRDDAPAVARLLAAGASEHRCVRVLALRLRCLRSVARPAAAAVLSDWAAAQRADAGAHARASAAAAERQRQAKALGAEAQAQQRRLDAAEAARVAALALAQRAQAEAAARESASVALAHSDAGLAEETAAAAAAVRVVEQALRGDASAAGDASPGVAWAEDDELAALEAWLAKESALLENS